MRKKLPGTNPWGNQFGVERAIKPVYLPLPDLQTAPIGVRLRFVRKRRGLTIPDLERLTRVSHGTISRLENATASVNVGAIGRLLEFFGQELGEAFPDGREAADQIVPVSDFGSWLRNFRLRRGLEQTALARKIGVSKVTVCHYERKGSRPDHVVVERLRRAFNLNGEFDKFL